MSEMAEAYASLVSIMHILDQLKNHPRPPISLDKQQVQSLTQNVTFLQDFLQVYNNHVGYSKEVDAIADAAHAVEDVIESHIVDQILADGEEISSVDFYEALQKVIDDMELLKSEIKDMREKTGVDSSTSAASTWQNHTMVGYDDILFKEVSSIDFDSFEALQKVIDDPEIMKIEIMDLMGKIGVDSSAFVASSTFASTWQNHTTVGSDDILLEEISSVNSYEAMQKVVDYMELAERELMDLQEKIGTWQNHTMVGFDNILLEVVDKLTSQKSSPRIISISGMGGIGKTTLATNAYKHDYVVQHFDFLAWFTISRVCNIAKILRKVLMENGEDLSQVGENDLGNKLHQLLSGRSYLIIMDDIWNIEVWDRLKLFLPDNNKRSRIMITTRLSNMASLIEGSHNIVMDFLDQDNSWKLFCQHVFGKQDCPLELKEIGKNIVRGCKGLPLSISVVGGLLAKSERTQQYWEHIAENLNSE